MIMMIRIVTMKVATSDNTNTNHTHNNEFTIL